MTGPVFVAPRATPGPQCRLWIPGMQPVGSGAPVDRSTFARPGTLKPGLTDARAWRNAGYLTTEDSAAGTDGAVSYPAACFDWDALNGDSFILAFTAQRPSAPTAEKDLLGNTGAASRGFKLRLSTAGSIKASISDGTTTITGSGSASICDGNDWNCAIWWDSQTRELVSITNGTENVANAYTVTGSTLSAADFHIGNSGNASSNGALAVRFRNLQLYVWKAQGLPARFRRGIDRIRAMPHHPINDWEAL